MTGEPSMKQGQFLQYIQQLLTRTGKNLYNSYSIQIMILDMGECFQD